MVNDPLSLATDSGYVFFFIFLYIKNLYLDLEKILESFGTVFKGQTKPSDFFGGQMFCVGSR